MDPVTLLRMTATAMEEAKENLEALIAKYSKEQDSPAERLKEVGEVLEVVTSILKEVHAPSTLEGLAVGKVVEEGLEEDMPPGLKLRLKKWPSEREDRAEKVLKMIHDMAYETEEKVLNWYREVPKKSQEAQLVAKLKFSFGVAAVVTEEYFG